MTEIRTKQIKGEIFVCEKNDRRVEKSFESKACSLYISKLN